MLPFYIVLGFLTAMMLTGGYLLIRVMLFAPPPRVIEQDRLQRYLNEDGGSGAISESLEEQQSSKSVLHGIRDLINKLISSRVESSSRFKNLPDELARADIKMKPSEWVQLVAGSCILCTAVLFLRFWTILVIPIGIIVGYMIPAFYLRRRQNRRHNKFEEQLGEIVVQISNSLKAGQALQGALQAVAKDGPEPIATEFHRVVTEAALGIDMEDALANLYKRNESEDVFLMMSAIQVHRIVGGNLAEILDKISHTIRERIRIKGEIHAITAQARISGYVIGGLPIFTGMFLEIIKPDFFDPMLHSAIGIGLIAASLFCMGMAFAFIRKIVDIKV